MTSRHFSAPEKDRLFSHSAMTPEGLLNYHGRVRDNRSRAGSALPRVMNAYVSFHRRTTL